MTQPASGGSPASRLPSPSRSFHFVPRISPGDVTPVPRIAKLYKLSSRSVFSISTVAERMPDALGSNVTENVVEPPAGIEADGWTVTVKSAACVPTIRTRGVPVNASTSLPVF